MASYNPRAAEVVIWHYTERGVTTAPDRPAPMWRTAVVRLTWTNKDWRLSSLPTFTSGPTPTSAPRAAPSLDERARLLGSAWRLYANTES
jgi:hypothetical protein